MAGASGKKRAEVNSKTLSQLRMAIGIAAALYVVFSLLRLGAFANQKRWWTVLVFLTSASWEGIAYWCDLRLTRSLTRLSIIKITPKIL